MTIWWQYLSLVFVITILGIIIYWWVIKRAKRKNYRKSLSKIQKKQLVSNFAMEQEKNISYIIIWLYKVVNREIEKYENNNDYQLIKIYKKDSKNQLRMIINSSNFKQIDKTSKIFEEINELLISLLKTSPTTWSKLKNEIKYKIIKKRFNIYVHQYSEMSKKIDLLVQR